MHAYTHTHTHTHAHMYVRAHTHTHYPNISESRQCPWCKLRIYYMYMYSFILAANHKARGSNSATLSSKLYAGLLALYLNLSQLYKFHIWLPHTASPHSSKPVRSMSKSYSHKWRLPASVLKNFKILVSDAVSRCQFITCK